MDSVNKFLEIFSNILDIIGFEDSEKERYISRFFVLVETKTIRRLFPRMDDQSQEALNEVLKTINTENLTNQDKERVEGYNNRITEIVKSSISKKELYLIYNEVIEDLFTSFLTDVLPETTEEQRKKIEIMMNSFANNEKVW